jgi:transcriptional regulator NrdR family protein
LHKKYDTINYIVIVSPYGDIHPVRIDIIMPEPIFVIKRDSTLEAFDPNHVARVVKAAGLTEDQAQTLSNQITAWVYSLHLPKISSLQIRDKVIEELKKVNENVANLFAWYETTKEQNPTIIQPRS